MTKSARRREWPCAMAVRMVAAVAVAATMHMCEAFRPSPSTPTTSTATFVERGGVVSSIRKRDYRQPYPKCRAASRLLASISTGDDDDSNNNNNVNLDDSIDVAIVGAGLGGLVAGAILNTVYGKTVVVYESHYLPGGCAHAFDRSIRTGTGTRSNDNGTATTTFTFDSGPTILLGCSSPPYNALRQVLDVIDQPVEWIPYDGWGMIERVVTNATSPSSDDNNVDDASIGDPPLRRWRCTLGPTTFETGPLHAFGGDTAVAEFQALRAATQALVVGASIPALAMRSGPTAVLPLLFRYPGTLWQILQQGPVLTGTFAPFLDGPLFVVTQPWLRDWLDALAFSLSGLPAARTAAASMAFVLQDMHRPGAALDYPRGGMGAMVEALVRGVEQGPHQSRVQLRSPVVSIDANSDKDDDAAPPRITGVTLASGERVRAKSVILNAPVWSLRHLIRDDRVKEILNGGAVPLIQDEAVEDPPMTWDTTTEGSSIRTERPAVNEELKKSLLSRCDTAEMTGSFIHLHLALNATGIDLSKLEAHYTVMDRSLSGDPSLTVNGIPDGPCAEGNMIALSNPCVLDSTLAPDGYILLHAYGAGNEPYAPWAALDDRTSTAYQALKEERAAPLWRAVEAIVPDARARTVLAMTGSPRTHERFLRRPQGTYGSATEDYLSDGATPFPNFVLANDGVFPGIGVPSVAIAGASAANSLVNVWEHWQCLDKLQRDGKLKV